MARINYLHSHPRTPPSPPPPHRVHVVVPHSQALQAELSGEYDVALKIYKKLMARYDTRFEKPADSQDSARGMDDDDDEEEGEDNDGEWTLLCCIYYLFVIVIVMEYYYFFYF